MGKTHLQSTDCSSTGWKKLGTVPKKVWKKIFTPYCLGHFMFEGSKEKCKSCERYNECIGKAMAEVNKALKHAMDQRMVLLEKVMNNSKTDKQKKEKRLTSGHVNNDCKSDRQKDSK